MESCQFSEGCNELVFAYEHSEDMTRVLSPLTTPSSPELLGVEGPMTRLESMADKHATALCILRQMLFRRYLVVEEENCGSCPIKQACIDALKASPPIDPDTGEEFRFD